MLIALILALGGGTTVALALERRQTTRAELEARQLDQRRDIARDLQFGLERYAIVLRGMAAFLSSSEEVTLQEFQQYGRSLRLETVFPGLDDIGYFTAVPWEQRDAFARELERIAPGAQLRTSGDPHELVVATLLVNGAEHIGVDVGADPVRREAFERARDMGAVAASRPVVQLADLDVPAGEQPSSVILYAPVYDTLTAPRTLEARRTYLVGWATLAFRLDLLADVMQLGDEGMDVTVAVTAADDLSATVGGDGVHTESFELFGQRWNVTFVPTAGYATPSNEWLSVLWAGASSTVGAAAVVGLLGSQRARLRRQVRAAIDETESANRRLSREVGFQRALLANLQVGVIAIDTEGNVESYNLESEGLFYDDLPPRYDGSWSELLGMYTTAGTPLPEEYNPLTRALRGERVRGLELVVRPSGSVERIVHCNGQSIVDEDGNILGAVVAMHDITPLKQAEQRLIELAHQDALTGLPNRTVLTEQTALALLAAERNGTRVGLLFLDLDGFKRVNDEHGHDVGDELLRVAAARLQQSVRREDLVSRLGGDEFVVLLRDLRPEESPNDVRERVTAALRAPYTIGSLKLCVGVSAGYALAVPGDDAASLQRRADQAMYRAKATRRQSDAVAADGVASEGFDSDGVGSDGLAAEGVAADG